MALLNNNLSPVTIPLLKVFFGVFWLPIADYKRQVNKSDTKALLDNWLSKYSQITFILSDPIWIPHQFSKKEDIEISGLFAALLAWGQRKNILKKTSELMQLMDMQPHSFVMDAGKSDLKRIERFVHRTFNGGDCLTMVCGLGNIYSRPGGMEKVVADGFALGDAFGGIEALRSALLTLPHEKRTEKHLPSPKKGSAAKRINMFFRWMVRCDAAGIDFGLWRSISPAQLMCPLDVHTGRVARSLGLLDLKTDNWKAVVKLTNALREFDPDDPVKYDIALFCGGLYELKGIKSNDISELQLVHFV